MTNAKKATPSHSSVALDELFNEGTEEAKAMKAELEGKAAHRTVLWRYRKGLSKPDAETVAVIERITHGRVPANGWESIDSHEAAS